MREHSVRTGEIIIPAGLLHPTITFPHTGVLPNPSLTSSQLRTSALPSGLTAAHPPTPLTSPWCPPHSPPLWWCNSGLKSPLLMRRSTPRVTLLPLALAVFVSYLHQLVAIVPCLLQPIVSSCLHLEVVLVYYNLLLLCSMFTASC